MERDYYKGMKEGEFQDISRLEGRSGVVLDAVHAVNQMWEKANDAGDMPLDHDLSYGQWERYLMERSREFVAALFEEARNKTGADRLQAARTLDRLFQLIPAEKVTIILAELMTTREIIKELERETERDLKKESGDSSGLLAKLKKIKQLILGDE